VLTADSHKTAEMRRISRIPLRHDGACASNSFARGDLTNFMKLHPEQDKDFQSP
jgi:hypothetical protein